MLTVRPLSAFGADALLHRVRGCDRAAFRAHDGCVRTLQGRGRSGLRRAPHATRLVLELVITNRQAIQPARPWTTLGSLSQVSPSARGPVPASPKPEPTMAQPAYFNDPAYFDQAGELRVIERQQVLDRRRCRSPGGAPCR